jgi:succinylglutamate desuccinylase
VGVHGDETGPIEVLAHLLDALSREPSALAVDLMLCVGNIDAIRAGKRFIDADQPHVPPRYSLAQAAEARAPM